MTTRVRPTDLRTEMSDAYFEYAKSVITARALPDAYDGLKPVQRRILYAASSKKLGPAAQHRKSATLVGEVIGNFHPHSDGAIYDALVRMAQPHSLRYPLIDGQGNFGTIDDPAAAMRYTECRLTKAGEMLTREIGQDTVDVLTTFDGSRTEPTVLPAAFPNLLANGGQGIAVGMATNIPPYNIGELVDLALWALDHPTVSSTKWPKEIVPAPDYPTGGVIISDSGCRDAVLTGRGRITVRATVTVEDSGGHSALAFTELPYQVSADSVLEAVGKSIAEKTEPDVIDVRNETSARTGLRVVLVLRSGADAPSVLKRLWRSTKLQQTYSANAYALVDGVPECRGVAYMLKRYLDGRVNVVERRTKYRLREAERKLEQVEGMRTAAANIEEVVRLIRNASTVPEAKAALARRFEMTPVQTQAVMDLSLGRLTGLSVTALDAQAEELGGSVRGLEELLGSRANLRAVVGDELKQARDVLDDGRRSALADKDGVLLHVPTVTAQVDASGTVRTGTRDASRGQGLWTIVGPGDTPFCAALANAEIASVRPIPGEMAAPVLWAGHRPPALLVLFANGRMRRVELAGVGPWKVVPPKGRPFVTSATPDLANPFSALFVVTAKGYILKFPKRDLIEGSRLQSVIRLGTDDRARAICDTATGTTLVLLTESGNLLAVMEARVPDSSRGNRGRRTAFGPLSGAVCVPSGGLVRVSNENAGASAVTVPVAGILTAGKKGLRVKGGATRLVSVDLATDETPR